MLGENTRVKIDELRKLVLHISDDLEKVKRKLDEIEQDESLTIEELKRRLENIWIKFSTSNASSWKFMADKRKEIEMNSSL